LAFADRRNSATLKIKIFVVQQVITTKTKGKERATMTLQPGTGYTVVTKNKANLAKVIIHNK
jgi:hypothetical protein